LARGERQEFLSSKLSKRKEEIKKNGKTEGFGNNLKKGTNSSEKETVGGLPKKTGALKSAIIPIKQGETTGKRIRCEKKKHAHRHNDASGK